MSWRNSIQHRLLATSIAHDGDDLWMQPRSARPDHFGNSGPATFLPDSYTPSYAYPLVCFLHDQERSDRDLAHWFPQISDQNYVAIAAQAPFPGRLGLPGRLGWNLRRPDAAAGAVRETIELADERWNIHPDRICLFGEGTGALLALQLFLYDQCEPYDEQHPLQGVIGWNLPVGWAQTLPIVDEAMQGRILLLNPQQDGESDAALDFLSEAGLQIDCVNSSQEAAANLINHWLMSGVPSAVW